jgi:hypothetical protein
MSGGRSIGERLSRTKNAETRLEIVLDWAESWRIDFDRTIRDLEAAVRDGDFDGQCRATGQIKTLVGKRLSALPRVINSLVDTGGPA